MSNVSVLEMVNITKRFPGVLALDGVSFDLRCGEVHALVGENGAGKSTLMKILNGALQADAGEIRIDGRPVRIPNPSAAARLGIAMIYQELCLAPHLSVGENLFLGREPLRAGLVDFRTLHARAQQYLDDLQCGLSSRQRVRDLGIAAQQMVEIAKALSQQARFLVMDEPTASLSEAETQRLFERIRALREAGVGIAYISHRLEEVLEIADRVTVLRDGKVAAAGLPISATSIPELVRLMVGREIKQVYPKREAKPGDEVLRVEGLSRPPVLHDVGFSLRRGEILGLGGLMGAGRTELARAIFGADRPTGGRIFVEGRQVRINSPQDAIAAGIALLTEDRKRDGLALGLPLRANVTLPNLGRVLLHGLLSLRRERQIAQDLVRRVDIRAASVEQVVRNLSGGNQQKVVVAKWLLTQARVFIFDEPTQGIDVGAKTELYRLIEELADQGAGVILISSYLPELLALSDRVLVLCRGRITGELSRAEATQERVLELAAVGH
jgi:ribose transport system ATP-binding protein